MVRCDVIEGADLLIGVSGARVLPASALARMNADPIVFALANPDPEVAPEEAVQYVRILATGRSDYPNQINNVLCFPGVFRGALDVRATAITESMKTAAARAIAEIVADDQLREDYIIPSVFNRDVAPAVAAAVSAEARVERPGRGRRRGRLRIDRGVRGAAGAVGRRVLPAPARRCRRALPGCAGVAGVRCRGASRRPSPGSVSRRTRHSPPAPAT